MRVPSGRNPSGLIALLLSLLSCAIVGGSASGQSFGGQGEEPNDLRWDLAKRLGFALESVQMSSTLDLHQDGSLSQTPHRVLTLSVRIRMFDINDLAAIAVDNPTITGAVGPDGEAVGRPADPFAPVYEPLYLHVDAGSGSVTREPCHFSLQLPFDSNQPVPASISVLRGYLYALYAADTIEADVPFKVGDSVQVLPDLEVCVTSDSAPPPGPLQASMTRVGGTPHTYFTAPICLYKYWTYVRSCTDGLVMAAKTRWPGGGTAVDYAVMETQLVDSKAKICANVPLQTFGYGPDGPLCSGCKEQDTHDYDVIRHIIAVKPYEVKMPFVLTNIPVPSPQPTRR